MPVPKSKQKKYGMIIGHAINIAKRKGRKKSAAKAYGKKVAEKWLRSGKK